MANHHFGKFADVWKHLVVNEVLAHTRPAGYAETHAGSAAYPMVDDAERRYGVLGFLDGRTAPALMSSPYARVAARYVHGEPALYPGSALQAMTMLGDECAYALCDLDPRSARDLRSWAGRLSIGSCEVVERDGMSAVRERLGESADTVVHIDPFDPFAHEEGAPSAIELAVEVAEAGNPLVYWYGYSAPADRAWAVETIRTATSTPLWFGDFMVTTVDGVVRDDGDLGEATTPGTGSGVVLANVSTATVGRCETLASELMRSYEGRPLPDGGTGRLDLAIEPL